MKEAMAMLIRLSLIMAVLCGRVMCSDTDDRDQRQSEQLRIIKEMAEAAAKMKVSDDVPFVRGASPNAMPLRDYLNVNNDKQENFYARLKIDGIQFIGKWFQTDVGSDVSFIKSNTHECGPWLNKTGFRPMINRKYVPVPCIHIGVESGAKVYVFGFAEEGIQAILQSTEGFTRGSVYQVFYDNFFLSVLLPAIHDSYLTNTYLRYSEMVKRAVKGSLEEADYETPIFIGKDEWLEIGHKIDAYTERFFTVWNWQVRIGLSRFGQSMEIRDNQDADDIIDIIGMPFFIDETALKYGNVHFAVDVYSDIPDTILVPEKFSFKRNLGTPSIGYGGVLHYPILGMGNYPGIVAKQGQTASLRRIRDKVLEKITSETTVLANFGQMMQELERPHCTEVYKSIKMHYFQLYYCIPHAVYPRRYKPHQGFPASDIIMGGLDWDAFNRLRKDFRLWTNLVEEIRKSRIPLRMEFVLEFEGPNYAQPTPQNPKFDCMQILLESVVQSVYGVYNRERDALINGALTEFLKDNLYIMPNFGTYIANTISAMYTMLFCPILDAYDFITESEIESDAAAMYDIQGVLTVHLAENLLLYMFDGSIAHHRDYDLLKKYYKVSSQESLRVNNIYKERQKCGGVRTFYMRSNRMIDQLEQNYFPYLSKYKNPSSYQKFFLLRQLTLTKGAITPENPAVAALYIDSCIISMRHFPTPILPQGGSTHHNWLTMARYRQHYGKAPEKTISVSLIAEYFRSPVFLKGVDTIALFFLRDMSPELQRFEKAELKHYIDMVSNNIKKHLYPLLQQYASEGQIQVFYTITKRDIEQLRESGTHMLKRYSQLKDHSKVVVGAEYLFQLTLPNGTPARYMYSVPPQITQEIVRRVFEVMRKNFAAYEGELSALNFVREPILPVIFRIWYADAQNYKLASFTDFLNHCAYALCSILSKITHGEPHSLLRHIQTRAITNFGHTHNIKYMFLEQIGLLHLRTAAAGVAPTAVTEDEIKKVYRYWLGATKFLEEAVPSGRGSERYQFFETVRQNRFHFTICDALHLNINTRQTASRSVTDYRYKSTIYPFVPNVYFFMRSFNTDKKPRVFDVQEETAVMRVDPKDENKRWVVGHDKSKQPHFLPIFMDRDADSIVNKKLHENLPYHFTHERRRIGMCPSPGHFGMTCVLA